MDGKIGLDLCHIKWVAMVGATLGGSFSAVLEVIILYGSAGVSAAIGKKTNTYV